MDFAIGGGDFPPPIEQDAGVVDPRRMMFHEATSQDPGIMPVGNGGEEIHQGTGQWCGIRTIVLITAANSEDFRKGDDVGRADFRKKLFRSSQIGLNVTSGVNLDKGDSEMVRGVVHGIWLRCKGNGAITDDPISPAFGEIIAAVTISQ